MCSLYLLDKIKNRRCHLYAIERGFKDNYNILFDEILKTKKWIRWSFIKRKEIFNFPAGDTLDLTLKNPLIVFKIEKKEIKIDIPTIYEDMFDLSLKNYFELKKFKKQFLTQNTSKKQKIDLNESLKYLCMYDIWRSIFYFRTFRFARNLGIFIIVLGLVILINPINLLINIFS